MYHPQNDKFSLNEKENIADNMEKFTLKVSRAWNVPLFLTARRPIFSICAGNAIVCILHSVETRLRSILSSHKWQMMKNSNTVRN